MTTQTTTRHETTPHRSLKSREVNRIDSPDIQQRSAIHRARVRSSRATGDLAAEVFERFERGESQVDVVQAMRVPPERVRAIHREWVAMKEPDGPSTAERLAATEEAIQKLTVRAEESEFGVAQLAWSIADCVARLNRLPLPSPDSFKCEACKATGLVGTQIQCTSCKTPTLWGFHPKG